MGDEKMRWMARLDRMMGSRTAWFAIVVGIACTLFYLNLGSAGLWDEDEPRNARCAVEMLDRQDWVVPTFNSELRTHKPILYYWLTIIAYKLLGITEFSARACSATAAVASVACLFWLVDRLFRRGAASIAAILLSSSMMFVVAARAATPDAVLIFCITLAMTIFVREIWATTPSKESDGLRFPGKYFFQRPPALFGFYATLGFAMLAKGPIGFVLPMAIVGMFLLIVDADQTASDRLASPLTSSRITMLFRALHLLSLWFAPYRFGRTLSSMRPMIGAAISIAVALPWYLAVGLATDGEWLQGFFMDHNIGRATRSMEGHSGSIFFYPLALCIGLFPWSNFMLASAMDYSWILRKEQHRSKPILLGICWIAVPMLLFTCSSTKLPSYITPGYPGIALVIASFLARLSSCETQVHRFWQQLSYGIGVVTGIALIPALLIAAHFYLPGDEWLAVIALPLCVGGILAFEWNRRQRPRPAFLAYAMGAVLFSTLFFAIGAPTVAKHRETQVLAAWARKLAPESQLAAYGQIRSSWVFYLEQPIRIYDADAMSNLGRFLAESEANFLLIHRSDLPELRSRLPIEFRTELEIPLFPNSAEERLLVIRSCSGKVDSDHRDGASFTTMSKRGLWTTNAANVPTEFFPLQY